MRISKFRRLPARYAGLLTPLILSAMMSAVVSFIATLKSVGLIGNLISLWLGAWLVSFLIAFPTLLVVQPFVRAVVNFLVEAPDAPKLDAKAGSSEPHS